MANRVRLTLGLGLPDNSPSRQPHWATMFRDAYKLASEFTLPVVISWLDMSGKCSSSVGAFVVINEDGWALTAFHLLKLIQDLANAEGAAKQYQAAVTAIQNDTTINSRTRKSKLHKLEMGSAKAIRKAAVWWSFDGVKVTQSYFFPPGDIAVCKLEGFNPSLIKSYPIFKDPAKPFAHGTSLCKLGFPFHAITPVWDDGGNRFVLPAGAIPIPRFPIDGIFTRIVNVRLDSGAKPEFPVMMIETSTPGLRGQSGGPTFDAQGTVWAIQSRTQHLPLGFSPPAPGGKHGDVEHQFLNVGLGTHPATFLPLLDKYGIKYQLAPY